MLMYANEVEQKQFTFCLSKNLLSWALNLKDREYWAFSEYN